MPMKACCQITVRHYERDLLGRANNASYVRYFNDFAFFEVVYAREFATWVQVALQARATVAGSEGFSQAVFFLPGLASDYDDCTVSPPGVMSPYGTGTCTDPD